MHRRARHRHHGPSGSSGTTLDGQPAGAVLRLVGVDGGPRRARRLMELGVRTGQTVVVTHTRGRSVVIAGAAGRVAVGPEMARHILVEEAM